MSDDPANFYARLSSAIKAEEARDRPTPKPIPVKPLSLSDLKTKATASELPLILAVEAAVRTDVIDDVVCKMGRAGGDFAARNVRTNYDRPHEWGKQLVDVMVKAAQPTDV